MGALDTWREGMESLAVPQHILDSAPESPWVMTVKEFRRRADALLAGETARHIEVTAEALPEGGTILDVGCGAGAGSLPLAGRVSQVTGVDASEDMLVQFREAAAAAGVPVEAVQGEWPDAAPRVDQADVVVCVHVLYNVQDLGPFIEELTAHARKRVVIEVTDTHPWAWVADLWMKLHGHPMPEGPNSSDLENALREMGIDVRVEEGSMGSLVGFDSREEAVAQVRRRLCLPAERDPEVAAALGGRLWEEQGAWLIGPPERRAVTMWWDAA